MAATREERVSRTAAAVLVLGDIVVLLCVVALFYLTILKAVTSLYSIYCQLMHRRRRIQRSTISR